MVKSHLLFFCFIQLLFVHAIEYGFVCDGRKITVSEISESAAGVAKQPDMIFGPKARPNIKISKTNDEVLQYNYRVSGSDGIVYWALGKGGIKTEIYMATVYCVSMSKVINYALRDDSVARISIGSHVLKGAPTVHVIDAHIPHFINVIDLKDDTVVFKFRDVDGKYHQLKFEPDEEDRKVIMIGTKSYSLIPFDDHSIWQWSEMEPGEPVPTISHVPTDVLRGAIAGKIGAAVAIKIGEYTVQREIPLCRVRAIAKGKLVPPKVSKPKVSKPKAVHKKKKISYEHCSIELPEPHEENPYIVDMPNAEIALIIKNAFPTQTKPKKDYDPHKRVLNIYDYAVKDMIAYGQQQYLEFISVMENFDAIIRKYKKKYGFGKTCTPEMAMMKVYEIYIGKAIEFDDIDIERRLNEAALHNFDPKETKEIDTKKGAWKDAKNEVYGKIKNYFDTCIPLSSPHTTNPRVQKTPTWTGYITDNFELKTDENIQKMYDVLIEMCGTMCICETYEFVSAVQYLKEIYEKYKKCDTEMMQVYKEYIVVTGYTSINIPGWMYKGIKTAAANKFKITEKNPNEGLWKGMESHIYALITKNIRNALTKTKIKNRYDESGAKESYYNELINYNEYYDSVYDGENSNSNNGYDVSFDSEYSNSNTYNGYDHSNSNNYNGGNRNSNFNLMNPILMLIGLIFCLCFICAALLNVISCGCCYVFGRYQTKIGDYKTQNDYEYNNNI